MADLTILSSQPLLPLPFSSIDVVSARHADHAGRSPTLNQPASTSATQPSNGHQHDTSLLSPPLHSFRAPRRARHTRSSEDYRLSPREVSRESEDEESEADPTADDDQEPQQPGPSYTKSFRPFSYHSAPNTTQAPSHSSRFQGGLRRPAPPLFRPKTFWRHTRRSAVTGPSYSPSSYIVRRSTFIAAGLSLDTPHADLSALGVELRAGTINLVPSSALLL